MDTPYYKGKLKAMCVDEPMCDLIIGNLPGSCSPYTGHGIKVDKAVGTDDMEQDATAQMAATFTRAQEGLETTEWLAVFQMWMLRKCARHKRTTQH